MFRLTTLLVAAPLVAYYSVGVDARLRADTSEPDTRRDMDWQIMMRGWAAGFKAALYKEAEEGDEKDMADFANAYIFAKKHEDAVNDAIDEETQSKIEQVPHIINFLKDIVEGLNLVDIMGETPGTQPNIQAALIKHLTDSGDLKKTEYVLGANDEDTVVYFDAYAIGGPDDKTCEDA